MDLKILIVEDELPMLNSQKMFFEMRGYKVFATGKGDEALNIVNKEKPHVIILDLHLNDSPITGIEVLKQTSQKYPAIKVIITTGYANDEDIRKVCMEYNPYMFLGKPVSIMDLKKTIDKIAEELKLQKGGPAL